MKLRRALLFLLALLAFPACAAEVVVLTLDGAVSPATADYVSRGIHRAADRGAALIVLKIDTPGGLDGAMRRIVRDILDSPVPVAAYVAPAGARAASAGTFILYASHVAAMSPATNLGAATPVQIGGGSGDKGSREDQPAGKGKQKSDRKESRDTLTLKQIHDAAAYIRSLAQLRGRNAEWAEKAVRESVSLSAEDAKRLGVVDLSATDVPDLLKQLNGRKITVRGAVQTLNTADAAVIALEPDWRSRLLAVIADPGLALILMMIGIYGLIFEFSNPGFVLPGVAGAICLLLGMFALQMLPINYAGLALIFLGIAFVVAEAFVPSGVLGAGGIAALAFGALILIDSEAAPGYAPPLSFILSLTLASAAAVFVTVWYALKARHRPVVTGREDLIGAAGLVIEFADRQGWARVRGETWRIRSERPFAPGDAVRVTRVTGLTLEVEPQTGGQP